MRYEKDFEIKWADLDSNRHARHSVFTDYATHVRFCYLRDEGFGIKEFEEADIGPVVFSEQVYYLREVYGSETITINLKLKGISKDGSLWKFVHQVFKEKTKHAATILLEGGWMNLKSRKLVSPPIGLLNAVFSMPKTKLVEEILPNRNYIREALELV
jgi:acyl-CoA thioester hydrolase